MPGPVAPEGFPSGYHNLTSDSLRTRKYCSFQGRDTLLTKVGESRDLDRRLILSGGCPVREYDFALRPGDRERIIDYICADGKVIGWKNNLGDSGVYFYKGGRLDSMIRFGKFMPNGPITKSRTLKIGYDTEGRPIRTQDYLFEGSDTASDSLTSTFTYHLPDSLVMTTVSVPQEETHVRVIRLSGGKIAGMTERVYQDGEVWVFEHVWTYAETASIGYRGPVRRSGKRIDPLAFRTEGGWWSLDGRRLPARP